MTNQVIKSEREPKNDPISLALEEARRRKSQPLDEPTVQGFDNAAKPAENQHQERAISPGNITRADSRILAERLRTDAREDVVHEESHGELIEYLRAKHDIDERGRLSIKRTGETPVERAMPVSEISGDKNINKSLASEAEAPVIESPNQPPQEESKIGPAITFDKISELEKTEQTTVPQVTMPTPKTEPLPVQESGVIESQASGVEALANNKPVSEQTMPEATVEAPSVEATSKQKTLAETARPEVPPAPAQATDPNAFQKQMGLAAQTEKPKRSLGDYLKLFKRVPKANTTDVFKKFVDESAVRSKAVESTSATEGEDLQKAA